VFESEQEYHDELSRLNVELEKCRLETSQHEAVMNSLKLSTDDKISRLQEDKAMLQVRHSVCVIFTGKYHLFFLFSVSCCFYHSIKGTVLGHLCRSRPFPSSSRLHLGFC